MNRMVSALILTAMPLISNAQTIGVKAGISSFDRLEDFWGPGQMIGISITDEVVDNWSALIEISYTEFSPNQKEVLNKMVGYVEHTDQKLVKGLQLQLSQVLLGTKYQVPESGFGLLAGTGMARRILTRGSVVDATVDPNGSDHISIELFGRVEYAFEHLILSGSYNEFYFDDKQSRTLSVSLGWMFFLTGDNQ